MKPPPSQSRPPQARQKGAKRTISIQAVQDKTGWAVKCPLGLWEVHAPTPQQAIQEGYRYLLQYLDGGEYNQLLTAAPTKTGRK